MFEELEPMLPSDICLMRTNQPPKEFCLDACSSHFNFYIYCVFLKLLFIPFPNSTTTEILWKSCNKNFSKIGHGSKMVLMHVFLWNGKLWVSKLGFKDHFYPLYFGKSISSLDHNSTFFSPFLIYSPNIFFSDLKLLVFTVNLSCLRGGVRAKSLSPFPKSAMTMNSFLFQKVRVIPFIDCPLYTIFLPCFIC